jgi:hypothetical protein
MERLWRAMRECGVAGSADLLASMAQAYGRAGPANKDKVAALWATALRGEGEGEAPRTLALGERAIVWFAFAMADAGMPSLLDEVVAHMARARLHVPSVYASALRGYAEAHDWARVSATYDKGVWAWVRGCGARHPLTHWTRPRSAAGGGCGRPLSRCGGDGGVRPGPVHGQGRFSAAAAGGWAARRDPGDARPAGHGVRQGVEHRGVSSHGAPCYALIEPQRCPGAHSL